MTDSRPASIHIQSAIAFRNTKPVWAFNETTAFPVEISLGHKTPTVYVYLTPYEPDELKAILRKATAGYRREKRDIELVKQETSIYVPLLDAHFVKLGNATGTPDEQKAWLDKYPEFKPSIVEYTFGGVKMDPPKTDEETDDILDISLELSGSVHVYQDIYDPVTDAVVRVDMYHNHSHPTEAQYREYRSARRSKFIRRTTLWTISEQHGTLEKLYDSVIKSVAGAGYSKDGTVFDCAERDKSEWLPVVPLWHKLWIVDQIFGELVEKNG